MFLFEIGHSINMHHEHLGDNTYIEIFANYQFFLYSLVVMKITVWC